MEVLKIIFYSLGLIPILYEFKRLSDPKDFVKLLKYIKDARKEKRDLDLTTESKLLMYMGFFFWIWSTVGLFTFQWPAFVVLYITSIIVSLSPKKVWIVVIDSILSILIILIIMVNSRLKIDLFEQLLILTL